MAEAKFCSNCAQPITPQMNACSNCGTWLKDTPQPAPAPAPAAPTPAAPVPQQPNVIVVGETPKKSNSWIDLLARYVLGTILTLAFVNGVMWASIKYMHQLDPYLPFVGLYASRAAGIAQNYVNAYFPEFEEAERTVSPGSYEDENYYFVDFMIIEEENPRALRIAVPRTLDGAFPFEYFESPAP